MTESWYLDPSVKNLYLFFGRQTEIAWVIEQLVRAQSLMAIYGPHRIGKTSLLHALIDRMPKEYLPVYLDADKADGWESASPLLQIAGEVGRKVREQSGVRVAPPEAAAFAADPLHAWQTYTDGLNTRLDLHRLVLMVDNVEMVAPEWLHVLFQTPVPVIVTAESYERLVERLPGETVAAPSVTLGPLENDAAEDLVKALVTPTVPIDPWAVRRMLEITSNQPYYIHLLCRILLECCTYKSPLMPPQVETALHALLDRPIGEFIVDWQSSLPREQAILSVFGALKGHGGVATQYDIQKTCARYGQYPPLKEIVTTLDGLAQRRLLEKMGANSYRFRLELFRLWIDHHHSPEDLFRRGSWRFGRSFLIDWAVKARAALARRRTLWWSVSVVLVVALLVGIQPLLQGVRSRARPVPTVTATTVQTLQTPTPTTGARPTRTLPQRTVALPGYDLLIMSRPNVETPWQVYALDMRTGKRVRVTETNANERTPKWSPDGRQIVFTSERDGDREIFVMDLQRELESQDYQPLQLTHNETPDWQPSWSPDGERIAFSSYRDGNWEIYVMDADGGNLKRVTEHPENDITPVWSPDGTRLVFVSRRLGDANLFVVDLASGQIDQITSGPWDEYDPAWSPDGEWIAFAIQIDKQSDVFVMRADGSEVTNLTNTSPASEFQPVWTADSEQLIFVSFTPVEGEHDLFIMQRDGSQVMALTDDTDDNIAPSLRYGE